MKGGCGIPKTYTTISGDTWDVIAYKAMGNEMYMDTLIKYNSQHRYIVIFPAGVTIEIPEVNMEVSQKLPPWKRVVLS